jgi:proline iminopeptidase
LEKTGYVQTREKHNLFYRRIGPSNPKKTLFCLHGGPGVKHDRLLPLSSLATDQNSLQFVSYDQLGGGRSDNARDKTLYNLQSFREHVEDVRQELELGRVCLLGHSMGGALGIEYTLKYPENVEKLIISNSGVSIPDVVRHMQGMKKQLPRPVFETLEKYEMLEDYNNPEYQKAVMVMYREHVCRAESYAKELETSFGKVGEAYYAFWGPNEFVCTGNTRDWNMMDQIEKIHVPTLIIVGRYDEVSVEHAEACHRLIKDSKLLVLEKSSHINLLEEEADKYIQKVRDFVLDKV